MHANSHICKIKINKAITEMETNSLLSVFLSAGRLCVTEETVLGQLCSCARYSALGMKFNVNDSTVHGKGDLNINPAKTRFYNDQLLKRQ